MGPNCGANCSVPQLQAKGTYSTQLFADRALKVLAEHDPATPLFLYMPFQSVHCPIQVPPAYVEPYVHLAPERQQFAGMLAALDEAVGRVVAGFQARGMWENTLTIFSTDNGGPVGAKAGKPVGIGCATGSQNWPLRGGMSPIPLVLTLFPGRPMTGFRGSAASSHSPVYPSPHSALPSVSRLTPLSPPLCPNSTHTGLSLHAGKGAYFQGGVRGAGWVHGNMISPTLRGTTNMELMHVTDWLPTLVAAAGGLAHGTTYDRPLDGVDQLPMLLAGRPSARTDLLVNIERTNPTTAACRGHGCADPLHPACNGAGQYVVIAGRHKLLLGGGGQPNDWYHDDTPYNGTQPVPEGGCLVACSAPAVGACLNPPEVQLFDVLSDEAERENLASDNPALVASLMAVVRRYNATEYVPALSSDPRFPIEDECPYNDAEGVLTPCA